MVVVDVEFVVVVVVVEFELHVTWEKKTNLCHVTSSDEIYDSTVFRVLIRLGHLTNTIDYLDAHIISNRPCRDDNPSQS